jgi:acylphosphatase
MGSSARVIFHGRVQGVFFRASTKDAADSARVTGWVRNLRDGSVEALFEGERGAVERLIENCRTGFPMARVDGADIEWREGAASFGSFEIRR